MISRASYRSIVRLLTLGAAVWLLASPAVAAPTEQAVSDIAATAVAEISEKGIDVSQLAVMPFANDPNDRIGAAVTAALVSEGFSVVDREEASNQMVFDELQRSASDLYDTENAPMYGRRLVAGAVMVGRITQWSPGDHLASAAAEMKIVQTETGQILWSGKASSTVPSLTLIVIVLGVVVVSGATGVLYFTAKRRRSVVSETARGRDLGSTAGKAYGRGKSDVEIRRGIVNALERTKEQLDSASSAIRDTGSDPTRIALKQIRTTLDGLRSEVENSPTGNLDAMSEGQAQAVYEFDEGIMKRAQALEELARNIAGAAEVGDAEVLDANVTQMKSGAQNLRSDYRSRDDRMNL